MVRKHRKSVVLRPDRLVKPVRVDTLEARLLMHAGHVHDLPEGVAVSPVAMDASGVDGASGTTSPAAASPLSSIPALSSRPTAAAKLYLDFDGDTTARWGSYTPGTTPAYDQDGDTTTFSDGELASIREIWQRVSEKYAPFNLDVTTVDPGNLTNGKTLKVAFGGDGAWLGGKAGGVAYVGGFTNFSSNVVFVFPKNLGNGHAQYNAEAAAHESGHGFGLYHQATWTGTTLAAEYAGANAAGDAPVMGASYTARRGLWWNGITSEAYNDDQDDLAVLSNTTNGFGYRADDFGNDIAAASTLTLTGTTVGGAGVIERTTDADVFSFVSGPGGVNLFADVAAKGAMLDLKMTLRDASGAVVASADTSSLGESLSATLAGGTYYLSIASHGAYGDIGQYTLRGTVAPVAVPSAPVPASGLVASTVSVSATRLAWADNAADESGFRVYVSTDNKAWALAATLAANATSFDHTGLARDTRYYYAVRAYGAGGESIDSNVASARTDPGIKGDANVDGAVDFADLVILSQSYNDTGGTRTWATGDFNGDGLADFGDLTLLSQNYNTVDATFVPGGTAAAPSTSTATTATSTTTRPRPAAKTAAVFSTEAIRPAYAPRRA